MRAGPALSRDLQPSMRAYIYPAAARPAARTHSHKNHPLTCVHGVTKRPKGGDFGDGALQEATPQGLNLDNLITPRAEPHAAGWEVGDKAALVPNSLGQRAGVEIGVG